MPKVRRCSWIGARWLLHIDRMTIAIPVERRRRALQVAHEPVCMRCGHGASLHPQRDLACLVCDQRASVGLMSHVCTGFISDRAVSAAR
jgi:hypothetical protein